MSTSVDDETILDVLRSNDAPRMTTTEVTGHLPVTRGTTRTRLQRLADDGLLERTTEGNNVVWWLPEREDEIDAWEADEEAESETADDAEAESEEAEEAPDAEDESDDGEAEAESEPAAEETEDETEIEVTATEPAESEEETEIEVEAVELDDESDDETPEAARATDEELPDLSDDNEGLRAVAAVAVGLVVVLLLRKLLGGGE